MDVFCVHIRGVPIYRISKISAADMAKKNFQYWQSVFYEIVPIFLPIFYTSTNELILLMHCLVITIIYCVDNRFTSFFAILLLLTMVYNEFYYIICAIHGLLYIYILDRLSVSASFQTMNIGYRKNGKI